MRGIVAVMVLKKLDELLKARGCEKELSSCFDLIVGTSTGGLIASSLVFPNTENGKANYDDLESTYMKVGRSIFPSGTIRNIVNVPHQVIADKYSVDGLEKVLSNWFGNKKMCDAKTNLMLVSYDLLEGKVALLKSFDGNDCTVAQACRATSAAPTYFAPFRYKKMLLADGGLVATNPSIYAYAEAKKLYPDCKKFHLLSIGTASQVHRMSENETSGLLNWIDQISPAYLTAQKGTVDYIMNQLDDVEYTRIDKECSEPIKMDDSRDSSMKTLRDFGIKLADESSEILSNIVTKLDR